MDVANKHKYLSIKSHLQPDACNVKLNNFENLLQTISTICKLKGQANVLQINQQIQAYKQNNAISNSEFAILLEYLFKIAAQNQVINIEIRIDLLKLLKNITEEEVKISKKINFETKKMIKQLYLCQNKVKEGGFINSDAFINELLKLLRLFESLDKVSQNKPLIIPHSYRLKTLPEKTIARNKKYFNEKQPFRQTFFSKRYSSSELQLKIRSKILSNKKMEESPERQSSRMKEKNRQSNLFPTLPFGQSPHSKKKYLFNFYHRNKQLSVKRPAKLSNRLE